MRETVLIADDSQAIESSFTISPDNRRVAFVASDGRSVVVDGQRQMLVDRVYPLLCFSPDSKRLAYAASVGGKVSLVVDGEAGKGYDAIANEGPVFSPDGQRIAYWAQQDGKSLVVVDGQERGDRYDGFAGSTLRFSPDGRRLAYAGLLGKQYVMTVDGVGGALYDGVTTPVFSPDSRRVGYFARTPNGAVAVVDGRESERYDGFLDDSLTFSSDSRRVAFAMQMPIPNGLSFYVGSPNKWVAVVDGVPGQPFDRVGPPIFSPDARHVAYAAVNTKVVVGLPPLRLEYVVVADDQVGTSYDGIGDGAPIFTSDNRLVYKAWVGEKLALVVDGVTGRQYDDLGKGPPAVSLDGKHVGYTARVGAKWIMVVDGVESESYDVLGEGTPVFSPDGARVAYDGLLDKGWVVVADGKEWPQRFDFTMRGTPMFSPDGNYVLSAVARENEASVVVDGLDGISYDTVIPYTARIVFDSGDSFHYLAIRGTTWYLVEETLE